MWYLVEGVLILNDSVCADVHAHRRARSPGSSDRRRPPPPSRSADRRAARSRRRSGWAPSAHSSVYGQRRRARERACQGRRSRSAASRPSSSPVRDSRPDLHDAPLPLRTAGTVRTRIAIVQPQRTPARVFDVQRTISSSVTVGAAVDLPQTGDAGLDGKARKPVRGIVLDLVRDRRPRSHQRHLAAQHVPQLRQLVEARAPQRPAEAGHALVAGHLELGPRRGVLADARRRSARARSRGGDRAATPSCIVRNLLTVNGTVSRPTRRWRKIGEPGESRRTANRDQGEQGREQDQQDRRADDVQRPAAEVQQPAFGRTRGGRVRCPARCDAGAPAVGRVDRSRACHNKETRRKTPTCVVSARNLRLSARSARGDGR